MRYFNTSGPNRPDQHYTLERKGLVAKGMELVRNERYFTIWAPRQTGKSTYFRFLAEELKEQGYLVSHNNFENFKNEPSSSFLNSLVRKLEEDWGIDFQNLTVGGIFEKTQTVTDKKLVLIIDEVEGINPDYFGDFIHAIRNAYHYRNQHSLKSVILVGVSNILGVVSDHASPFNIADNLDVPYFTDEETAELLGQHETETGQRFEKKVVEKISEITANQPGLVNGFAKRLVDTNPDKPVLTYAGYLKAEDWYINEAIDKNISNVVNKAKQYRGFVERLLFTEGKVPFKINRPAIKLLHTNGLVKKDENGNVKFWVPLYKKCLYDTFYPYTNGEKLELATSILVRDFLNTDGKLNFEKLITNYKQYVQRRSFRPFREKDKDGNFKSIMEAALLYSFETYIHAFIEEAKGKIYREADTGLGKSDFIINLPGQEYLLEAKRYYGLTRFEDGKKQLVYYCKKLNIQEGVYLVFVRNTDRLPEEVVEQKETLEGISLYTFLVVYDEVKDF